MATPKVSVKRRQKKGFTNHYDIRVGNRKQPVGYVNTYQREHIGIQVNARYRNRGVGGEALNQAARDLKKQHKAKAFYAYVNQHNKASMGMMKRQKSNFEYGGQHHAFKTRGKAR